MVDIFDNPILCKKCGKRSQIRTVKYSRYYWYEKPYSCMGGAMWHSNGFMVVCPKCGKWEHVHEPTKALPQYDLQEVEYRIMRQMLKFATQYGDIYYSDGEYDCKETIEWEHK